ncbi:MAG: hypothetical protein P1V20_25755, partial [Verrucomicrobiales bacterium]|nr:hypothetical protein [Verrucomicrobiales bacterium]
QVLKPLTERISVHHKNGIIHIVYTSKNHEAFRSRVDQLLEQCFFTQRLTPGQCESEGIRLLNHPSSGLLVVLHAAL